jgi:hypothetical protein
MQSRCKDCKKKRRRCSPDHLIEELPGEQSNCAFKKLETGAPYRT